MPVCPGLLERVGAIPGDNDTYMVFSDDKEDSIDFWCR